MTETLPAPSNPLAYRDFRMFWIARFCAVVATMGMVVIIGYQLYDTARSDYGMSVREAALQLGLLGLAQFVPLALLTPVAGWVADRFDDSGTEVLVEQFLLQLYAGVDSSENDRDLVPREVLVPVLPSSVEPLSELLSESRGSHVSIRVPQRGDKRALMETVATPGRP